MKIIKTASGKSQIKLSRKEWESIGKKAGWTKTSSAKKIAYDSLVIAYDGITNAIEALKDIEPLQEQLGIEKYSREFGWIQEDFEKLASIRNHITSFGMDLDDTTEEDEI